MKHSFRNDYSELAHENILKALLKEVNNQNIAYGNDVHSENAKWLIKKTFKCYNAAVYLVSGGTQANMLVISYLLRHYEGVISCDSGHINVHETAAIEGNGNKVYTVKNTNGKLTAEDIKEALRINKGEHMVKLKMVYISNSTEMGTIYTKEELLSLRKVCDEYNLYLFIDGARLASALTCKDNDVTPELIGEVSDVFYVGGTKNGTLSGEAIVFKNKNMAKEFNYHIKNKGALLAKGFVLGIQFEEMFKNNLYFELATHANKMADYIKENLNANFYMDSPTNQIFIALDSSIAKKVIKDYDCELWESYKDFDVIRIVTSFATKLEDCKEFVTNVNKLISK